MGGSFGTLALLLGVILIAGGITMAFVTGFDLRFTGGGAALIAAGFGLVYTFRPKGKFSDTISGGSQRSVQKPMEPSETTKQRINRRL
jgi:hypothetical protein